MTMAEQNRVFAWRLRDYSALRASPARFARGRRRRRRRSTSPNGEVVEPACYLSGVRIKSDARWKANCGICAVVRGFAG